MIAATAQTLRFFTVVTLFGIQEFCKPCADEQVVTDGLCEVDPGEDRCCDSCGAYRRGSRVAA